MHKRIIAIEWYELAYGSPHFCPIFDSCSSRIHDPALILTMAKSVPLTYSIRSKANLNLAMAKESFISDKIRYHQLFKDA